MNTYDPAKTQSYYRLSTNGILLDKFFETRKEASDIALKLLKRGFSIDLHKTILTDDAAYVYKFNPVNNKYSLLDFL